MAWKEFILAAERKTQMPLKVEQVLQVVVLHVTCRRYMERTQAHLFSSF